MFDIPVEESTYTRDNRTGNFDAVKDMPSDKEPRVDGFPIKFLTIQWNTAKEDVVLPLKEFFHSGKLLKSFSYTVVTLVLKVVAPTVVNDYRPIAYCNTVYKIITKVLTTRMKKVMNTLVLPSQHSL